MPVATPKHRRERGYDTDSLEGTGCYTPEREHLGTIPENGLCGVEKELDSEQSKDFTLCMLTTGVSFV